MTGATGPNQIDLSEQLVRIQRMIDESDKFRAEQRKLMAEAAKFDRDRWLAPVLASVTAVGAVTAAVAAVVTLVKVL